MPLRSLSPILLIVITSIRNEGDDGTRLAVFGAAFICRPFAQNSDWHPLVICTVGHPAAPRKIDPAAQPCFHQAV